VALADPAQAAPGLGPVIATDGATGLAAAGGTAVGFGGSDAKPLVCACAAKAMPATMPRLKTVDLQKTLIDCLQSLQMPNSDAVVQSPAVAGDDANEELIMEI
jgi:hypothetical protein